MGNSRNKGWKGGGRRDKEERREQAEGVPHQPGQDKVGSQGGQGEEVRWVNDEEGGGTKGGNRTKKNNGNIRGKIYFNVDC